MYDNFKITIFYLILSMLTVCMVNNNLDQIILFVIQPIK